MSYSYKTFYPNGNMLRQIVETGSIPYSYTSNIVRKLFALEPRFEFLKIVDNNRLYSYPLGSIPHFYIPSKQKIQIVSGFKGVIEGHEIAHFLEMKQPQRLTLNDFGIPVLNLERLINSGVGYNWSSSGIFLKPSQGK